MYKLTVVAGPNRGTSYAVQDGELSIGRQSGNTIVLASAKVSKRHCVLTVSGSEVTVQDQGSSNGTFVNGILTKVRGIKAGDRISVGEFVLELSEPVKRSAPAPAIAGFGSVLSIPSERIGLPPSLATPSRVNLDGGAGALSSDEPPKDLKGKMVWFFENRFMPIFYGMNLKYEWNVICTGMFVVLLVGGLLISVYPLLESNHASLIKETGIRARFMAKQIAEQNAIYLASRNETRTEIGSVENADGVRVAVLIDLENRIIAPPLKKNQYLASGAEAGIAIKARDRFRGGGETGFWVESDDLVIAVEPVKILSASVWKNTIVAMAVVSIDATLSTPDSGAIGTIYSETLILNGILAGIVLLILYRLTLKPYQQLNEDLDKALKGDLAQVTHEFRLVEMDPLWDLVNSAIQRIPRSGGGASEGGDLGGAPGQAQWTEEVISPMRMIGGLVKFGMIVFDSDKRISYINPVFEEISGIRNDAALGQEITNVARDQSMGMFTNDLLGRASAGQDGIQESYDFSGIGYSMHAAAFGGAGGSPKCFVMLAVKSEG